MWRKGNPIRNPRPRTNSWEFLFLSMEQRGCINVRFGHHQGSPGAAGTLTDSLCVISWRWIKFAEIPWFCRNSLLCSLKLTLVFHILRLERYSIPRLFSNNLSVYCFDKDNARADLEDDPDKNCQLSLDSKRWRKTLVLWHHFGPGVRSPYCLTLCRT